MLESKIAKPNLDEVILSQEYSEEKKCELIDEIVQADRGKLHQRFRLSRSALHLAVSENLSKVVKILLGFGLSPNMRDKHLQTPMHIAASLGFDEILGILCQNPHANIHMVDWRGNTVLLSAVRKNHLKCMQVLSQFVLNVKATNKKNKTAQDYIDQIEDKPNLKRKMQRALDEFTVKLPFSQYQRETQQSKMDALCQEFNLMLSVSSENEPKKIPLEVEKSLFVMVAHSIDTSINEEMLKGSFFHENLPSIFAIAETIKDDDLKQIVSIIYQNCFKLKFNNQEIIKTVYGLFDQYSLEAILLSIKIVAEKLEGDQLLVSHYFVKQILQVIYERNLPRSAHFEDIFSEYCDVVKSKDKDDEMGWVVKLQGLKVILSNGCFVPSPMSISSSSSSPRSWTQEVQTLIDFEGEIEMSQLQKIMLEMRALSLGLYQSAISNDFCGNHWIHAVNKWHLAPTISEHCHLSTVISHLIVQIILTQQSLASRTRAIELFIKLLHSSAQVHDGVGPDFDTMMSIAGALNLYPIGRLASWAGISPDSRMIWTQMMQLVDPRSNFQNMRICQNAFPLCIPFLGMIKKDLTASHENHPHMAALYLGGRYQYLQFLRENLSGKHLSTTTDFLQIIRKPSLTEDELIAKSLEAESRIPVLYSHDFDDIIKDLEVLRKRSLPLSVKVGRDSFEGKKALTQIALWLRTLVNQKDNNEVVKYKLLAPQIMSECVNYVSSPQAREIELEKYLKEIESKEERFDFRLSLPSRNSLLTFSTRRTPRSTTSREKKSRAMTLSGPLPRTLSNGQLSRIELSTSLDIIDSHLDNKVQKKKEKHKKR